MHRRPREGLYIVSSAALEDGKQKNPAKREERIVKVAKAEGGIFSNLKGP